MVALSAANIFVYNGFGLEKWAAQAIQAVQNTKLITVDSSEGANPLLIRADADGHSGIDPHLWLSPKGAQIQTRNIAKAFIAADPLHAEAYTHNADAFIARLEKLYIDYNGKFASVSSRTIVTGHAAFGYLCRDFGLTQNSVEDVFATGEPNAQKLAGLIDYARKEKVKMIFVEQMVSPAVSQTLADEVGAKVQTIYTMESAEGGKTYLVRMRENLEAIYQSLVK